jgi:ferredoxin-nitrite reductase
VLLVNVPDRLLPALLDAPLLQELRPDPSPAMRGTVSCVGIDYCTLALAETKARALEVIHHLERTVPFSGALAGRPGVRRSVRPLTMYWSGCPAGCGNHQAADIGFLGGRTRVNGSVIETFDIFVEGRTGPNPQPGEKVLENVPAEELPGIVEQLAQAHARGQSLREAAAEIAAQLAGNAVPFPIRESVQAAGAG